MYTKKATNGIRYSSQIKEKAITIRKEGKTHREIAKLLGVSVGTAHLWTIGIILSSEQKQEIQMRKVKPLFSQKRRELARTLATNNLKPYQYPEKYNASDLLDKIREFYRKHRRIPLKREFNMYAEYKRRFGNWNKAIELAGFSPNQVIFSKKFIAQDSHKCDSFSEKIIDDWLLQKNIAHNRHVPYGKTKMTADFAIHGVRIEFFGLAGEQQSYDAIIQRKRNYCMQHRLKLVEIYPKDLMGKRNFETLLGELKNTK